MKSARSVTCLPSTPATSAASRRIDFLQERACEDLDVAGLDHVDDRYRMRVAGRGVEPRR